MKKPKSGYHRHHKIPKHAGGSDADENIEYLTIEEHIKAHRALYEQYGKKADLASANLLHASLYLSFNEEKQRLFREMCVRGAHTADSMKQASGFYKKLGRSNSEKLRGRVRPDLAEAQARKWRERQLVWCNDGEKNRRFECCPDGWNKGRLPYHTTETKLKAGLATADTRWWTNGINNQRSKESPGEGWTLGRSNKEHP